MVNYFSQNYVWNLSANIAVNTGGHPSEVEEICRRLARAAARTGPGATEEFLTLWSAKADQLAARARVELDQGRELTAGDLLQRASVYYLTGERMASRHFPPRWQAYRSGLSAFAQGIRLGRRNCELVEVPYEHTSLPALFIRAADTARPAPTVVAYNGLDSTKEMVYGSGLAQELSRRGYATLIVDHPGSGEALRLRGLTGRHDSEHWSGPVVDYLQTRPDVNPGRIGVAAWSLGGYYAPRAAAFEKRFKICVAWGANFDWGELQRRRLAHEGDRPVPHYWDHVQWVFGKTSREEFMAFAPSMTLVPVINEITVPFLVTHGADDTQVPVEFAQAQYERAVNSPSRHLRIFTAEEGGSMHCSADNMSGATAFISDWIAEQL